MKMVMMIVAAVVLYLLAVAVIVAWSGVPV